jgi:3-oxoisoapionate decarboxylase
MLIGIGSYTFSWGFGVRGYKEPKPRLDWRSLLQTAHNLKADVVQLADNYPVHLLSRAELADLRSHCDELGLEIELGTSGTGPGVLESYLELAGILNAKLVRTLLGSVEHEPNIPKEIENLRRVAPVFERAGVVLAIENYELYSVDALAAVLEAVGSPNIGACLDVLNSMGRLEPPDRVVEALADHTYCLHVKDFRTYRPDHRLGYIVEGTPVGEGLLDVGSILDRLPSPQLQSVILELWTPYQGSVPATVRLERDWATKSMAYLSQVSSHRDDT